MAAEANWTVEKGKTMDAIEQAEQATELAASEFAEGAVHVRDATAAANDQVVRAGVELMQRNAETMQHALRCGARLASRLSERSADQLGRAAGISGDSADDAARRSSRNFAAIMQTGAMLTEITQRLCEEWADIGRARLDRGFDRFDEFLQCRTPQEFAALSSEMMRDNMETFLSCASKAGEHSARIAAPAYQQAAGRRQA